MVPSYAEPIRNGRMNVISDHERPSRSAIAYDRSLFTGDSGVTRPTPVEDALSPQDEQQDGTLPMPGPGAACDTNLTQDASDTASSTYSSVWFEVGDDDQAFDRTLWPGRRTRVIGLCCSALAAARDLHARTAAPGCERDRSGDQRTHPDIAHSVDPAVLGRAIEDVRAKLDHPMSAGEAWTVLSRLNSVMADGHLAVTYPGGAANEIRQYVNRATPVSVRRVRDTGGRDVRSRQTR